VDSDLVNRYTTMIGTIHCGQIEHCHCSINNILEAATKLEEYKFLQEYGTDHHMESVNMHQFQ
jgi:hypothetical protein